MKLQNFDSRKTAIKALKENYNMDFNPNRLSLMDTKKMLKKVRSLAFEAKQSRNFYENQKAPSYMKLVFMEQALVEHYNRLMSLPKTRIVVEASKVEESQVTLAAQELVDTVQKMIVDTSDIMVKELPALVQSVKSDIGANEGDQYNQKVSEALTNLTSALTQAKTELESALGIVTGEGGGGFEDADMSQQPEEPDMGGDMSSGGELPSLGDETETDVDLDIEEPMSIPGAGRPKR
jgi:hypothetical protein